MRLTAVLALTVAIALGGPLLARAADTNMPPGWFKAGSNPGEYDMGVDLDVRHDGKASAFIRSNTSELHGFGTMMQTASAKEYLGKRVRFSGYVKSEKVDPEKGESWAGLWLRIDGAGGRGRAGFDNMQNRPIKGTTDWKRYEIVLDVAPDAYTLNFGMLLHGSGRVWMDGLKFEVVGTDVPLTSTTPPAPVNLDFDASGKPEPKAP